MWFQQVKSKSAIGNWKSQMRSARSINSDRPVVTDKREAILRAAIRVFAHNGYFNSKVADIASEAGVADGTVYLYFKSKEEILHRPRSGRRIPGRIARLHKIHGGIFRRRFR